MKIALLGYGIEGESAYTYLRQQYPDASFVVYDQAAQPKNPLPEGVEFKGSAASFHDIDADLVIRTPAIRPDSITSRGEVTSVTKLFFAACPAPIIGVTGSKGKGSTASLIASILQAAGKDVQLVGNIGDAALDVLTQLSAESIVVYELSSFQLWDLEVSPHIAVVLMIEPDHLDIHTDMEEYVAAKRNIAAFQAADDTVVYYKLNNYSRTIGEASLGRRVPNPSREYAHVQDGYFWYSDTKLCPVEALKLPGTHNQDNATAAIAAVRSWVQDGEIIARGLSGFTGLPHRLKFVREVDGVRYYDDSIATTPGSAIAALRAFDEPKVLILGGSSKGADFTELAQVVAQSSVRKVVLIGEEAPKIAAALYQTGVVAYEVLEDVKMDSIVATAKTATQPGDVVILSPACASFGMFKNYKDRGEQFIAAVNAL